MTSSAVPDRQGATIGKNRQRCVLIFPVHDQGQISRIENAVSKLEMHRIS
jgi:hypothetical protein